MNRADLPRLLLLVNILRKESILSSNGAALLKNLVLAGDPRVANLLRYEASDEHPHVAEFLSSLIETEAERIHTELYEHCSLEEGKRVSFLERDAKSLPEANLIYGEVNFKAFAKTLYKIAPKKEDVFYDLGSGTGRAVFVARLLFDFERCEGIELLEGLDEAAQEVHRRYEADGLGAPLAVASGVRFTQGSVLELDWSDGDVVFANSTCFEEDLMAELGERGAALKPGAYFVTFTKRLPGPHFYVVEHRVLRMSWGPATVFIQRRLNHDGSRFPNTLRPRWDPDELQYDEDGKLVGAGADDDDGDDDGDGDEAEGGSEAERGSGNDASEASAASDASEVSEASEEDEEDGEDEVPEEDRAAIAAAEASPEGLLFRELYSKWHPQVGRRTSEADRYRVENPSLPLTYGEVKFGPFVVQVLERVRALGGLGASEAPGAPGGLEAPGAPGASGASGASAATSGPSGLVFTDVGCGTAKPVFAAALTHPFALCRGVELLEDVAALAEQIAGRFESVVAPQLPVGDARRGTKVEIVRGDALGGAVDWSDSDVVFTDVTTVFTPALHEAFRAQAERLKRGAIVVTTTSPIKLAAATFEILEKAVINTDWGHASLFIQRRL